MRGCGVVGQAEWLTRNGYPQITQITRVKRVKRVKRVTRILNLHGTRLPIFPRIPSFT